MTRTEREKPGRGDLRHGEKLKPAAEKTYTERRLDDATAKARRMVVLMWVLTKRRRMYADIDGGELAKKFRYYTLAGWESLLQVS